jgi:hypothetical protein
VLFADRLQCHLNKKIISDRAKVTPPEEILIELPTESVFIIEQALELQNYFHLYPYYSIERQDSLRWMLASLELMSNCLRLPFVLWLQMIMMNSSLGHILQTFC